MKSRMTSLFVFVCILLGALLIRTAYLQFIPQDRLNALQERQFQTVVNLPSRRGSILDRNGKELAMSVPAFSVFADPKMIENRKHFIKYLSQVLSIPPAEIRNKIKDKEKRFVWLDRLVSPQTVQKIKDQKISGVGFVEEWKRVYPNDNLLSNTIGYIGKEGQGLEGLEHKFDQQLKGESKKVMVRRDARGRPLIQDGLVFTETPQGVELKLTVDTNLQYFVESELQSVIEEFKAEAGYVVVLDAQTSAIRAVASLPHYDLNSPGKATASERRNRSITDTFEPGSTMKTFVIAEALEKGLYKPNSKIFCENGKFRIGNRIIREAEADHAQGLITLTEILQYSSNIGTAKMALKLTDAKLSAAMMRFGFGERSGVDLPGEAKGILVKPPWKDHLTANVSFGHGITVTPLQMANAYAAIANGGVLNQPYIVESLMNRDTNEIKKTEPKTIRRVLSEKTATEMRMMLSAVTSEKGTGVAARVPGYIVGGKTGTAQKVKTEGRGYIPGGYISSFAGFVPANRPEYVIYIAIDHPKKAFYGSQVAAPLFSRIASYALRQSGIPPELIAEKDLSSVPEFQTTKNAETNSVVVRKVNQKLLTLNTDLMPELTSMTLNDVLLKASQDKLKLKFTGATSAPLHKVRVSSTLPISGDPLDAERNVTIELEIK